jgi:hypothetical protein
LKLKEGELLSLPPLELTITGHAAQVWEDNADMLAGKIYGPHFEDLAREWCLDYASTDTLGGAANQVRPTEIPCSVHKGGHEIDLVVTESGSWQADRITAIGEAKGKVTKVGSAELNRLEHLRELLPANLVADRSKLLLFSRSGFTVELASEVSQRADVELIDLERLYQGQ